MALNIDEIAKAILSAAVPVLKKGGSEAKSFAEMESIKLAQTLVSIEALLAQKKITEDQAKALVEMQRSAAQAVLLAVEGIGILTAQRAVNAAIRAVAGVVNDAVHFPLLPA